MSGRPMDTRPLLSLLLFNRTYSDYKIPAIERIQLAARYHYRLVAGGGGPLGQFNKWVGDGGLGYCLPVLNRDVR